MSGTTTTRYLFPWWEDALASLSAIRYEIPVNTGTIRKMRVRHNVPDGNGNPIVYTLRVNGVATALSVSIASTAASGTNLVASIPVVAGDLVDVEITKTLSVGIAPTNVEVTMELAA